MLDLSQLINQASGLQRRGDLAGAERLYLQGLKAEPGHLGLLQGLGFLRYEQGRLDDALASIGAALKASPQSPTLLLNYAVVLEAMQRRVEALAIYDRVLAIKPDYVEALFNRGVVLRSLGRPAEALASFEQMLALAPDDADTLNQRGSALRDLRRSAEALESYDKALGLRAGDPDILNNRGNALRDLGRAEEALESYDQALAIAPRFIGALNNRGSLLQNLSRPTEALASFDRALALRPGDAAALYNRANTLLVLKRPAEALESIDKALAGRPNDPEARNTRGLALSDLGRYAEAINEFDRAISFKPDFAAAFSNKGSALSLSQRHEAAFAAYERALAIKPDDAQVLNNRGAALHALQRHAEALASFDKALQFDPKSADAYRGRGFALSELKRGDEAVASYERALALDPANLYLFSDLAGASLALCDWSKTAAMAAELERRVRQGKSIVEPLTLMGYSGDPALQLECAKTYVAAKISAARVPLWKGPVLRRDKLRIAYLSSDFRRHAVALLSAELFEHHDRTHFETFGISFGQDDRSETRARVMRAFDRFHDVRTRNDLDVARLLTELQIDIAIDLNGHTSGSRPGILAHRPAPIQISYLGYASTMGANFIDYILADEIALPAGQQEYYSEKIVHLPDCFLPNDSTKSISSQTPTRQEAGLPEVGFVFCCFNNTHKITPALFDIWMRLLTAIDGSVLWLAADQSAVMANLRREAALRNIHPARLIFAPKLDRLEDHLARHRLADLFLDTLPYNAHATASDALWAGLPLVTCTGTSFAGRVATSLVHAIGLPDLATRDLVEYEVLALRLASDPPLLQEVQQRLARNRSTLPLFDTKRRCRHIESAYQTMWDILERGEAAHGFSVAAIVSPQGC
jgi:predicted O-linked N-acetylglucosamine transferase (SPINDLY family)